MAGKNKKQAARRLGAVTRVVVLLVFGFSGAAALVYEVTWTRLFSLVFGSSSYAVSTMLTAFMAGLSLGSFLAGRFADRLTNRLMAFGLVETSIGAFGILSLILIGSAERLYFALFHATGGNFTLFTAGQFVIGFAIMLLPTTLMGATFPLASRILIEDMQAVGREASDLYSVNTLGSIIGSFAAGFILIPLIGVNSTVGVAALTNVIGGAFILLLAGKSRTLGISGALLMPIIWLFLLSHPTGFAFNLHILGNFRDFAAFQQFRAGLTELYYRDDPNGQVSVLENAESRFMRVAGKTEGSTGKADMPTQVLAGAVPVRIHRGPVKKALVIGLGTGVTLGAMSEEKAVSIDCVELNASVVEAARKYFPKESNGALEDPRVRVILADGRNWLMVTDEKYDVISSEPSYPTSQGVANLFTDEFYSLVKKRLKPGGILCQWAPVYIFGQKEYEILTKTIGRHFRKNMVVFNVGGDALFLCSDSKLSADARVLSDILKAKGLRLPEVKAWLHGPELLSAIQEHDEIPVNTDDSAVLEYRAVRNFTENAARENGYR